MRRATVTNNEPAGTQLGAVSFDLVPDDYKVAGQWAKVKMGDVEGQFAFASSPREPLLLLAKDLGAAGNALSAARPGDVVQVGEVHGGFPLERVAGLPLVLLAGGSGISALRPVVEAEVRAGLPRPVYLLYGVLSAEHTSFVADLNRWRSAGVFVHVAIDRPFVQDVAKRLGLVRADVGVLMAGVPEMLAAARAAWSAAGVSADRLLVNF